MNRIKFRVLKLVVLFWYIYIASRFRINHSCKKEDAETSRKISIRVSPYTSIDGPFHERQFYRFSPPVDGIVRVDFIERPFVSNETETGHHADLKFSCVCTLNEFRKQPDWTIRATNNWQLAGCSHIMICLSAYRLALIAHTPLNYRQ